MCPPRPNRAAAKPVPGCPNCHAAGVVERRLVDGEAARDHVLDLVRLEPCAIGHAVADRPHRRAGRSGCGRGSGSGRDRASPADRARRIDWDVLGLVARFAQQLGGKVLRQPLPHRGLSLMEAVLVRVTSATRRWARVLSWPFLLESWRRWRRVFGARTLARGKGLADFAQLMLPAMRAAAPLVQSNPSQGLNSVLSNGWCSLDVEDGTALDRAERTGRVSVPDGGEPLLECLAVTLQKPRSIDARPGHVVTCFSASGGIDRLAKAMKRGAPPSDAFSAEACPAIIASKSRTASVSVALMLSA